VSGVGGDRGSDPSPEPWHDAVVPIEPAVTPDDVERAAALIEGRVRRTPVIDHGPLALKLELLQHAGSFKTRGAFNRVLSESSLPSAGVITASGGNHGAALSYVGGVLGVRTEVFMPSTSPDIKRRNIERFGATVRVVEGFYDDAQAAADARQAATGATMIHPYDHPATVAGQGTMGRELEDQVGAFDTLVVAAGGGGFVAGQAAWFRDRVRIVAVEPETSQCLRAARLAGEPVDVPVSGVAADSLGARRLGGVPWSIVRHFVDDAVVVPDDAIRDAQRELWDELRLIAEPGGAAALAAIRVGAYAPASDERVVVVVCGSNCDPATITG
jgi:threonine dehydratase